MITKTGTKDRTIQALMGLLEGLKVEALVVGKYGIRGTNPVDERRCISEFTGKSFDRRDKDAANKCMRYTTIVNWLIPHLNQAIRRLEAENERKRLKLVEKTSA